MIIVVMPGLHVNRKDRKHMLAHMFSKSCNDDKFIALKSSLKHHRRHILRSLKLYGEHLLEARLNTPVAYCCTEYFVCKHAFKAIDVWLGFYVFVMVASNDLSQN